MLTEADDVRTELACHVYGAMRATASGACEGLLGLDRAPTRLVTHGSVAAVVSDLRRERPPGRRAELLAYHHVLEALAENGPVAPVQFGSVLRDEQAVIEELLVPEEQRIAALLDELEGRAQFRLRAAYVPDVALAEVVTVEPEIARLREVTRGRPTDQVHGDLVRLGELVSRAMEVKREHDTAVLLDALTPRVAVHRVQLGAGVDDLAEITLLVDDAERGELTQMLEELAEAVHERIRLSLVGPLPADDFVGDF